MDIARYFVATGAVLGGLGMVMGIAMGVSEDFTLSPAHAHLNLVGWVSLVLFGLAYRVELAKTGSLATVHYWMASLGAIVLPLGIYVSMVRNQPAIAIIGAILSLASMVIFIVNVWRAPHGAQQR
jgi:cbb3-type cytochrome oxidase subunit 1